MATGTAHVSPRPLPAAVALRIGDLLGVRTLLALMIAASTAIRAAAATAHVGPTLYPDEYIYTALARSIGTTGKPLIRGHVAHFPALLEPLLAAPLWALAPVRVAYHLTQIENAFFMSLAAVPVYLLARRLDFGATYSLVCAAFALAVPDLAFAGYTTADPLAYPLALAGLYCAVVALQQPTRRRQLVFLLFAGLATFARVEYVVLVPAFVGAALVTRRAQAFKTHRATFGVIGAGAAVAFAVGPARVLGYYKQVLHLHVSASLVGWIGSDLFLLAVTGGMVLVPGALVGLAKARGPRDAAFSSMAGLYTLALLIAAGLYASNGSDRFQERYLFTLLPLIPLAFGLYVRQGRPTPRAVAILSALLFVASVRLPLSHYSLGAGSFDSPLLWAVERLEVLVGTGSGSLLFAAYLGIGAVIATAVAFGFRVRLAMATTLAFLVATSVLATSFDVNDTKSRTPPGNPTWIDDSGIGDVTAVGTPLEPGYALTNELYWNHALHRELVLQYAQPSDAFSVGHARIASDGTLLDGNKAVRSAVLFGQPPQTARFQDARLVSQTAAFALWRPLRGAARLALLEQGRYADGWLTPAGTITLWPKPGRLLQGVLTFQVSLPDGAPSRVFALGKVRHVVRPGRSVTFRLCIRANGRSETVFRATPLLLSDQRQVSAIQTTPPRFQSGATCAAGTP